MIVVYTLPNCPQCKMTKNFLFQHHVRYQEVDLTKDQAAREKLRAAGYQTTPVVMTPQARWYGFRPDYLRKFTIVKAIAR